PQEPHRLVCTVCGFVFYLDPKLSVIAVIPMDQGVVMVRRAINPGYGLWVAPGGFVDLGEVLEDALVPLLFVVNKALVNPRITGWVDNIANFHRSRWLCVDGSPRGPMP
ncbi:MAG: NUDIX domain-containing protein, partial [Phenylobacterium sp.]|nr:NUDIX domain-containing protein [Phenylobacterium sp.]